MPNGVILKLMFHQDCFFPHLRVGRSFDNCFWQMALSKWLLSEQYSLTRFSREISATKIAELCAITDIPLGVDNSDSKSGLHKVIVDLY